MAVLRKGAKFIGHHLKVVTYKMFQLVLKGPICKIGLNLQEFSSHYLRSGDPLMHFNPECPQI